MLADIIIVGQAARSFQNISGEGKSFIAILHCISRCPHQRRQQLLQGLFEGNPLLRYYVRPSPFALFGIGEPPGIRQQMLHG
ncbi:hypothetical protein D3C73_1351430 [compost metagenome]